jgi:hypothetical protein
MFSNKNNMRFFARRLAGWLLLAPALTLAAPTDSTAVEKSFEPEMVRIKAIRLPTIFNML